MSTYLGGPEDPTDVPVEALVPGTRIDSFRFDGGSNTLVVQRVVIRTRIVRIEAANFSNGDTFDRHFLKGRMFTASGKI